MQKRDESTSIRLRVTTLSRLSKLRLYPRETHDEVVRRLLAMVEKQRKEAK